MKETLMRTRQMIATTALALACACGPAQPGAAPTAPGAQAAPSAPASDPHAGHDHSRPVTLTATPSGPYTVGEPVSLTLRLTEADGHPIAAQDLALNHDHLLHVMAVDAGLEDYTHAHPEPQADGSFRLTFTPRLDRPYRLWAEFALGGEESADHAKGGHDGEDGQDHEGHDHEASTQAAVDLPVGTGAVPAFEAVQVLSAQAGDLRFQLSLEGALRAGQPANVRLAVIDAQGQPFTGLEPLMGAFAHAVAFDSRATTMMHVHPEGAEPADAAARGGPVLAFVVEPEVAGPQRLFVQVRANGSDLTIPFTVVVGP